MVLSVRDLLKVGSVVVALLVAPWHVQAALPIERVTISEAEGSRIAAVALRYAEFQSSDSPRAEPGMPFLWGGRSTIDELARQHGASGPSTPIGVDASGLVVNAFRTVLGPGVRFVAQRDDERIFLADATSHMLYQDNVHLVEPHQVRPGDLLFFGADGKATGVAVIVERDSERIHFAVASERAGRVIRTFARIEGEYWQNNILGVGRFLKPAGEFAVDGRSSG